MITLIAPDRGVDPWGSGDFGAPRGAGAYAHEGHDVAAWPGSEVMPIAAGRVTKVGFVYTDGTGDYRSPNPYRYIEVKGWDDHAIRYFYVRPLRTVEKGTTVDPDRPMGVVQDLWRRFPPTTEKIMVPHVHIEIRDRRGSLIDPKEYRG